MSLHLHAPDDTDTSKSMLVSKQMMYEHTAQLVVPMSFWLCSSHDVKVLLVKA